MLSHISMYPSGTQSVHMDSYHWKSEEHNYWSSGNLMESLSSTYVQAVEEVLVDTGLISLPFLDDYFIPFSVILHRSSAVAKYKAPIVTSLTEKNPT